jgi:hypothetical protein
MSNDHQKLDCIMQSLDQQIGPTSAEDKQQMHRILDFFKNEIQNEDPNGTIYCNEGHLHLNRDVNVWGSCPDMM